MIQSICYSLHYHFKKLKLCLTAFFVTIMILIFLYYGFGIYILINEYNQYKVLEDNCDSKIWYYGIFSLIAFTDKMLIRNMDSLNSYSSVCYFMLFIEFTMVIFGSIELWNKNCIYDYISKDWDLYIFCILNYVLQIIITILISAKIIIMNKNFKKVTIVENFDYLENEDNEYSNISNYEDNRINENNQLTENYDNIYRISQSSDV